MSVPTSVVGLRIALRAPHEFELFAHSFALRVGLPDRVIRKKLHYAANRQPRLSETYGFVFSVSLSRLIPGFSRFQVRENEPRESA